MHRSAREEIANSVTHGIGAILAIAGLVLLIVFAASTRDVWRIVSCTIYGVTLVLLYTSSTLYHSLQSPRFKRVFHLLDHSCIYLLIAGTYTPFTLVTLRGLWGWSLFGVIWAMAVCGLIFKWIFMDRYPAVSLIFYLLMGWLAIIAIKPIFESVPLSSFLLIAGGGLLYMIGVFFFVSEKRLRYSHAIWHVFVLGGSICHYFAILFCVVLGAVAAT